MFVTFENPVQYFQIQYSISENICTSASSSYEDAKKGVLSILTGNKINEISQNFIPRSMNGWMDGWMDGWKGLKVNE